LQVSNLFKEKDKCINQNPFLFSAFLYGNASDDPTTDEVFIVPEFISDFLLHTYTFFCLIVGTKSLFSLHLM
jgi:hypothetical protein